MPMETAGTAGASATAAAPRDPCPRPSWPGSTPTGAPPTTSRSARSTCSTTRCCASRSSPSTSSRGCSATGARRPGLNFIYAHLNRVIRSATSTRSTSSGPGHGGPALVANAYLEGTYTEVYPSITRDADGHAEAVPPVLVPGRHPQPRRARDAGLDPRGRRARLRARRTPTAPPSTTPTWSSACVVGDGEAETGPLAASWHSNKFLDPVARRRGPADPAPQRLQDRQPDGAGAHPATTSCAALLRGLRLPAATSSRATTRPPCTSAWPRRSTRSSTRSARIQRAAREGGVTERPALADDRPADAQGLDRARRRSTACRSRAPGARTRCPLGEVRDEPGAPRAARGRGCAATGPRSCSTTTGALDPGARRRCRPRATGG